VETDVIEQIKRFLHSKRLLKPAAEIKDDASLLDAGLIDSLAVVELAAFLEERFQIRVDEDDLIPDNFDSFRAMHDFVKSKTA
jgi:acyl carrier protein